MKTVVCCEQLRAFLSHKANSIHCFFVHYCEEQKIMHVDGYVYQRNILSS